MAWMFSMLRFGKELRGTAAPDLQIAYELLLLLDWQGDVCLFETYCVLQRPLLFAAENLDWNQSLEFIRFHSSLAA